MDNVGKDEGLGVSSLRIGRVLVVVGFFFLELVIVGV